MTILTIVGNGNLSHNTPFNNNLAASFEPNSTWLVSLCSFFSLQPFVFFIWHISLQILRSNLNPAALLRAKQFVTLLTLVKRAICPRFNKHSFFTLKLFLKMALCSMTSCWQIFLQIITLRLRSLNVFFSFKMLVPTTALFLSHCFLWNGISGLYSLIYITTLSPH